MQYYQSTFKIEFLNFLNFSPCNCMQSSDLFACTPHQSPCSDIDRIKILSRCVLCVLMLFSLFAILIVLILSCNNFIGGIVYHCSIIKFLDRSIVFSLSLIPSNSASVLDLVFIYHHCTCM